MISNHQPIEFMSNSYNLRGRFYSTSEASTAPCVIMAHGTSATISMAADVDDAKVRVPRDMIERIIIVLLTVLFGLAELTLALDKIECQFDFSNTMMSPTRHYEAAELLVDSLQDC